jgi:hypothetical protein
MEEAGKKLSLNDILDMIEENILDERCDYIAERFV